MKRSLSVAFLAGGILAAGFAARAECKFQKIAEVAVTMDGLTAVVQAKLNGKDAAFEVGTGAFFSGVRDETVAAYGMHPSSAPFGLQVKGLGGAVRDARAVTAEQFSFGQASFKDLQFLVGGRMNTKFAGVIGENLMGPFDVEYDFANGMMRYFKASGCGGANLAYWASGKQLSKVPLDSPASVMLKVVGAAHINGRAVRVKFDSSGRSMLSLTAASRVGVQPSSAGVTSGGVIHGLYGAGKETFQAPFDSFKIGDEEIKNTKLLVTDLALDDADMLLGGDFFLSHRILISGSQKAVYFTYNGGPVFRLEVPPPAAARVAAQGAAEQIGRAHV